MPSQTRVAAAYMERQAMEADPTYQQRVRDIKSLVQRLERALQQHQRDQRMGPKDWGYVGDMNAVKEYLGEAVQHLEGH